LIEPYIKLRLLILYDIRPSVDLFYIIKKVTFQEEALKIYNTIIQVKGN
jgi:hypothetical protein